ncbi:PE family protein [Mycobacterium basiliense]|uniref:PE family protein n=1 Tax=Mycobacterium basiliense TaxID=2094119 RepID=A0A3S4FMP5_9MYCO|nr:PE family protein [Mycobacterium basiliense]VDM88720.1 PE family protein [Mycobacterium basiliense]
MSFVNVVPDMVAAAAGNVESIGSALNAANAAAAVPTVEIMAPALDDVSAAITAVFGSHAQEFQALSVQASAFHEQFVNLMNAGAAAYSNAESSIQQGLLNAVNGPAQALLGHPLIDPGSAGPAAASVGGSLGGGVLELPGDPLPGIGIPISYPVSMDTPLGPVALTLNGTYSPVTGQATFDSGSLTVPAALKYGVGALGPFITTSAALQASGAAFANAVQTGDILGAAGAVIQAPGSALYGFLLGQTAISQAMPAPDGSGYTSAEISVPVGGLLAPTQVATLTLTPTSGAPTAIQLDGTQFGGLLTGLLDDFVPGF